MKMHLTGSGTSLLDIATGMTEELSCATHITAQVMGQPMNLTQSVTMQLK
jgi:hypothetical protein